MAGRRKIGIEDRGAWVFNRMAHVYGARPPYPAELVDALSELAGPAGAVADVGAGTGHLAIPLAERGLQVHAVEPAEAMLTGLREHAERRQLPVRCLHGAAEALPLPDSSMDLAIIADAMHFLDAALTGQEVRRVLKARAALTIVTCELGDTPYMRALVSLMEQAAPRRPRATERSIAQVAGVAGVVLGRERLFEQHVALTHEQLELVLRSISFIGPAMNPERFASFWARVRAVPEQPIWSRMVRLRSGRRG